MQKPLNRWLLTSLIISLGFGQLLRFEIFGIPLFVHDILVVVFLTLNLRLSKFKLTLALKIFFAGLILGWIRAITLFPLLSLLTPMLYSGRIVAYLLMYQLLHKTKIDNLEYSLLISGGITLVIGLLQYFLFPDMRIFAYLGWDDHLNRLTLPHFDPTFTGAMLVMYFCLSLSTYRLTSAFYLLGILLTYSRSIWLSFLLALSAFIQNKRMLLLIYAAAIIAVLVLPTRFGEGNNLLRTFSITSRLETDWHYLAKYPFDLIFGRGMNTLAIDLNVGEFANHASGPNNSYLYLLLTSGITGLIGWGLILRDLYRDSHHKPLIIFITVGSLFNNLMLYPFTLLLLLFSSLKNK